MADEQGSATQPLYTVELTWKGEPNDTTVMEDVEDVDITDRLITIRKRDEGNGQTLVYAIPIENILLAAVTSPDPKPEDPTDG